MCVLSRIGVWRFPSLLILLLAPLLAPQTAGQVKSQAGRGVEQSTNTSPQAPGGSSSEREVDPTFRGLKYRLLGPFRGGRSLTAAGIPGDPTTYYFGAVAGGVWKSVDGANSWVPIFDTQNVSAIGSLGVSNSDPQIIYVGTGEALRGNISHGDGMYKSVDGGRTWRNIGLRDSRAIGKVIVNPTNPDIVIVAAFGHPYGPNTERGIFRTKDGGKSWEKLLYVNEDTGAIDVAFDPHNSNILFAAMWQARRMPWALSDGGPGSGALPIRGWGRSLERIDRKGPPRRSLMDESDSRSLPIPTVYTP